MRLKTTVLAMGAGLALVVGLGTLPTDAQEARPRSKTGQPPRGAEVAKAAHPAGVHVPDHFNQIEPALTPEQRERIYEIQAKALRESEAVLTASQRENLMEHRAKARAPRSEGARGEEPKAPRGVETTRKKAG